MIRMNSERIIWDLHVTPTVLKITKLKIMSAFGFAVACYEKYKNVANIDANAVTNLHFLYVIRQLKYIIAIDITD